MSQRHLDRLTALDASFLHQEGPESHMHIGGLTTFDGPPPTFDELIALIGSRLHLVPRYRQRLVRTPLDRGRPVWIDDAAFRLEYHVRHVALPEPGDRDQLLTLLSRIFSTQLDRRRPLWELWFVEGLAGGGFAFIFKTHHAVIDGIAGVDLATVIFDLESQDEPEPEPPATGLDAGPQAGPAGAAGAGRRPRRARQPRPGDRRTGRRRASAACSPPPARRRRRASARSPGRR
jgi:diacylglycerol O-acyltransferase